MDNGDEIKRKINKKAELHLIRILHGRKIGAADDSKSTLFSKGNEIMLKQKWKVGNRNF